MPHTDLPETVNNQTLIDVQYLSINLNNQPIPLVDEISFQINKGETLCLVGESGCGKSLTALALMGLLPEPTVKRTGGKANFANRDLFALKKTDLRQIRGDQLAMIFQEPMTSLNPAHRIGDQITETILEHQTISKKAAINKAVDLLDMVKIPNVKARFFAYPHELSGGMRQRIMIAIAMANNPKLLIADEPTTALDVTVQREILLLIKELQKETETAVLFITHDLGVVATIADNVAVMYAGHIVESGDVASVFHNPQHPYTLGLISAMPDIDQPKPVLPAINGIVPTVQNMPPGCRFSSRCPFAENACNLIVPPDLKRGENHKVKCINTPLEENFIIQI